MERLRSGSISLRALRWALVCAVLCAVLCLSVLLGCNRPPAPAAQAQRFITIGGGVTEIVFALGRGADVVAVDTSSVFPTEVIRLPKVGYQRTLAAEGVLALRPTRVLLTDEAGPPAAITQLRASGVDLTIIPSTPSVEGAQRKIRMIAELLAVPARGAQLSAQLDDDLRAAAALPAPSAKRVLFLYSRGAGTLHVGGAQTHADEMIRLAGASNVAGSVQGYKPFSAEVLLAAHPDVVLVTTRGLESMGGQDALYQLPGFAQLPVAQRPIVIAIDDLLLLGFGPRLGQAVQKLRTAFASTTAPQAVMSPAVQP